MKTLELNQMGNFNGGTDILEDKEACNEFALGVGGAAALIGVASWWTGVGAGVSALTGLSSYALSLYCASL